MKSAPMLPWNLYAPPVLARALALRELSSPRPILWAWTMVSFHSTIAGNFWKIDHRQAADGCWGGGGKGFFLVGRFGKSGWVSSLLLGVEDSPPVSVTTGSLFFSVLGIPNNRHSPMRYTLETNQASRHRRKNSEFAFLWWNPAVGSLVGGFNPFEKY